MEEPLISLELIESTQEPKVVAHTSVLQRSAKLGNKTCQQNFLTSVVSYLQLLMFWKWVFLVAWLFQTYQKRILNWIEYASHGEAVSILILEI